MHSRYLTYKINISNPDLVGKLYMILMGLLFSLPTTAQTVSILADFTASTVPLHAGHSPEDSLRTQTGHKQPFQKKAVDTGSQAKSWLTALYLRPAEDKTGSRTVWPLVPALLLEASPAYSVETPSGPKTIAALRKGDVLYYYNPSTQQVITWEVGLVNRKSRRVESLYSRVGDPGDFLPNSRVALEE